MSGDRRPQLRRAQYGGVRPRGRVRGSEIREAVGMRMTPGWRKALLTLHVITAVGWLGVDLVQLTFAIAGTTGADKAVVYPALGFIGLNLFVPLSFAVWLVGVVSSLFTPWGLLRHW